RVRRARALAKLAERGEAGAFDDLLDTAARRHKPLSAHRATLGCHVMPGRARGARMGGMEGRSVNPILNVSDFAASVAWFERLGWRKLWDWGDPPTFGAVRSGAVEVFLCQDGQGGRASDDKARNDDVWMSVWVDDVDEVHRTCV